MNKAEFYEILKNAVIETVESIAFVALADRQQDVVFLEHRFNEPHITNSRQSMLSVYQPVNSEYNIFVMTISPGLLKEIACNIFCLDPAEELSDETEKDTISELLNTISGRFMREITPNDEVYELGLPVFGNYSITNIDPEKILNCLFESENGEQLAITFLHRL